MTTDINTFTYDNEEESEMGQLHAIHLNLNAVAVVRERLAAQAANPSLKLCIECDESIPELRRKLVPGVQRCVPCQEHAEH